MSHYRSIPLIELISLIIQGDTDALHELHANRSVCLFRGKRLVIAAYLLELRLDAESFGWGEHGIRAYDLALDRFLCRSGGYGLFKSIEEKIRHESSSDLDKELLVAELLRKLVLRHFRWCLKESARSTTRTRYTWGSLELLLPRTLSGSVRRQWLETHFPDVDVTCVGERDRIQSGIDELIGHGIVSLDEGLSVSEWDLPSVLQTQLDLEGLGSTVAEEKVANMEDLRPSIRCLGVDGVRRLVRSIFDRLLDDQYDEHRIADEFGVSASTFSRFAGLRARSSGLPDLWANVASVIRCDPVFLEMVQAKGFL